MSWLKLKNGLLLKLADLLQTLAAVLTPKAHAPGLQEDAHPPAEDDFRAQWIKRYKTSSPPEDWLKLVAENSGSAGSGSIDAKVERDRLLSPTTEADVTATTRAATPGKIEPGPPTGPRKEHPSQQPQPKMAGAQQKSEQVHPDGVAPIGALLPASRIESGAQEPWLGIQALTSGTESAVMLSADQTLQDQELRRLTTLSAKPKQESWLSRTVRRITAKLWPAAQSSAGSQTGKGTRKLASTSRVEHSIVSGKTDASIAQERQQQSRLVVREQKYRKTSSVNSGESILTGLLPLPSPQQNEIAIRYERSGASGSTLQTPPRQQRETTAPVVPWPKPPARIAGLERAGGLENGHGSIPVPASFHSRERNLTTAAASSWTLPADQEIAPGLPSMPAEFQSSAGQDNSEALYPWPELPQIAEEDADEPRKLLQNHERQLRVLREQRGAW